MTELCEWNPARNKAAFTVKEARVGCPNEATWCLGRNVTWHVCDDCAELPLFKRFKKRVPLVGRAVAGEDGE